MGKSTSIDLTIKELEELLKQLFNKLWETYPDLKPLGPDRKPLNFDIREDFQLWMIGHNKPASSRNLLELIKSDSSVENFLADYNNNRGKDKKNVTLTSSHLYKLIQALRNRASAYTLKSIHKDIYFKFLGYQDVEDFRSKLHANTPSVDFKGYYFSQIRKCVRSFDLKITKLPDNSIDVSLIGFHDGYRNDIFSGKAGLVGHCWNIQLTHSDLFVNVIIHVGNFHVNSYDILTGSNHFFGIISGTNSEHHLFSSEFILLNENNKDHYVSNVLNAERYLNLTRNHFSTGVKEPYDIKKLDRLKVENNFINGFERVAGKEFRVLIYTNRSKLIAQSKLTIEKDYSCKIRYPELNSQPVDLTCLLSANENHSNRLFIEAFYGDTLYAFTTINLNHGQNNFHAGAYCIILMDQVRNPIGGIFHLVEDKLINDDEVGYYTVEDFQAKYSANRKTINAANALIEILSK